MVSESPLHRRSQHALESLHHLDDGEGDLFKLGSDDYLGFAGPGPSSDMPDAMLALPEAESHIQNALSAERGNFLAFVADAIEEQRFIHANDNLVAFDEEDSGEKVSFETLLPPEGNSRIVVAQALMMTLELGTKGLVDVHQEEHFEQIELKITEKGKVALEAMPRQDHYDGGEELEEDNDEHIGGDGAAGGDEDDDGDAESEEDDEMLGN